MWINFIAFHLQSSTIWDHVGTIRTYSNIFELWYWGITCDVAWGWAATSSIQSILISLYVSLTKNPIMPTPKIKTFATVLWPPGSPSWITSKSMMMAPRTAPNPSFSWWPSGSPAWGVLAARWSSDLSRRWHQQYLLRLCPAFSWNASLSKLRRDFQPWRRNVEDASRLQCRWVRSSKGGIWPQPPVLRSNCCTRPWKFHQFLFQNYSEDLQIYRIIT